MDLSQTIGKELIVKPSFRGSFFIHTKPDFEGDKIEMYGDSSLGKVKTFVKSKTIPGVSFIVTSRDGKYYYTNLDFMKDLYFSSLKGNAPEIVDSKKKNYTNLYLLMAAALGIFILSKSKK